MSALPTYPAYKPAAVPWLQQVPEHWGVERAKSVFRAIDVKSKTGKEELLTVSSANGIVKRRESHVYMFKAKTYVGHKLCWPEDLVVNSLWAWGRGLGFSREHGIISTAYGVYRLRDPQKHLWQYLDYTLRSSTYQWELQVRSKGVWKSRLQLTDASFFDMPILMPPQEDAELIVRYLHALDAKVKRYIRTKRKLIAALQEQKQAIIQRAVTRGLDPNVKLKPSGVEWLGEVPEGWELIRIKYLLREVDARSKTGKETLLSMRMHHGLVPFAEHFSHPPQGATMIGFKVVEPGQVVVNRMQAGNGLIFKSGLTGLVSPDYAVFDCSPNVNVDFLMELFRSRKMRTKFRQESKGLGTGTSGFLRLYNDRLGAIHIALPPIEVQTTILVTLEAELRGLHMAVQRVENEINLMLEYHTRLIADVVTGAVDVSAVAKAMAVEAESTFAEDTADEEEPLSMAAEGEAEYGESEE